PPRQSHPVVLRPDRAQRLGSPPHPGGLVAGHQRQRVATTTLTRAPTAADVPCSSLSRGRLCPGGGFVVDGVGFETSVEDADQAVAELAESGLVTFAAVAQRLIVSAGTGRALQRAEGPLVDGVAESAVAGVAGQHDTSVAGGAGDRRGTCVVPACRPVGQRVRVVAELAENPSAEHGTESGLAQVALSVPV